MSSVFFRKAVQSEELRVRSAGQLFWHRKSPRCGFHQLLRRAESEATLAGRRRCVNCGGCRPLLPTSLHLSALSARGTEQHSGGRGALCQREWKWAGEAGTVQVPEGPWGEWARPVCGTVHLCSDPRGNGIDSHIHTWTNLLGWQCEEGERIPVPGWVSVWLCWSVICVLVAGSRGGLRHRLS